MPPLARAAALYLGDTPARAAYLGDVLVWEPAIPQTWDPDTQQFLDATGLDETYAPALDGLVRGLKGHGLWEKMAAVYPMIGGTADLHKWNLIDPRDTDDGYRLTFIGGTHSLDKGYTPNPPGGYANGGYADSHCIPLGLFDQNSTHLAYYSMLDVPGNLSTEMGCFNWTGSSSRYHIVARDLFYYGMSESASTSTPAPSTSGLFIATRTAANAQAGYINGALAGSSAVVSIPLPPKPIYVGGRNGSTDRSQLPCGFASIGSGLDAQNAADLYTVVQDYQTALGRAVSPGTTRPTPPPTMPGWGGAP
jgi:hypothetical protein